MKARLKSRPNYMGLFLPIGAIAAIMWFLVS